MQSKGLSRVFSNITAPNINSYVLRFLYGTILISMHDYWKKAIILTRQTIVVKAIVLLFNMLSSFVIVFSSKEQASFNFMAAVTICSDFGAKKSLSLFPLFPHLFEIK